MLLALDPGQNSPGAAIYTGDARLRAAGRVRIPDDYDRFHAGRRWYEVAKLIVEWVRANTYTHCEQVTMVFECPQWYERAKSKVNPNKLVGIAGVAANVTGLLHPDYIESPTPADWIGQLSKECPVCKSTREARQGTGVKTFSKDCSNCHGSAWETPRGRYIRRRLSQSELALVPDQNDAIDAVGLGLWALGRLTPHSNFSNGHDGR